MRTNNILAYYFKARRNFLMDNGYNKQPLVFYEMKKLAYFNLFSLFSISRVKKNVLKHFDKSENKN